MSEKKEKVLSTRVNDFLFEELQKFSKKQKIKPSTLFRNALVYYYTNFISHEISNNPILILSKSEIALIISKLEKDDLEGLAEKCFQNGLL